MIQASDSCLKELTFNLLIFDLNANSASTKAFVNAEFVVAFRKYPGLTTCSFFFISEPVLEQKLHFARHAITNEQLESYNQIALSLFETLSGRPLYHGISVLKSAAEVGKQTMHMMYDGLHQGEGAKQHVSGDKLVGFRLVMYGGIGLFLWYWVVVSVSVISSRYLPIPLKATQMVKKYILFCIYVPLYPSKLTEVFLLKKLQFHNLICQLF